MENYIVSARKYRPSTFQSVVGQKALVQTLKAAVATRKLAHAYLFCGTRGVGKTTCARIFAKTINCMHPTPEGEACNECESCRAFNEQRSLNIMELDAASNNSVEDIRQLIDKVRVPPQIGEYKVYIIDEVHMLSTAAFNAFLKTLEEPPRHAIFILATTEKHKLLPTILSRCQIYDFQRITMADIADHLRYVAAQEGYTAEEEALNVIAQKADGGMRDALSIFDQIAGSSGGNITYRATIENLNILDYDYYFRLTDALLTGNVPSALLIFDEVLRAGFAAQLFVNGLSSHFRDLMVCRDAATRPLLEVGAAIAGRYAAQAAACSNAFLYEAMALSNRCDLDYRISNNKRLLVELMLIRICQLSAPQEPTPRNTPPIQPVNTTPTPAPTPTPTSTPTPVPTPGATASAPEQKPAPAAAPRASQEEPAVSAASEPSPAETPAPAESAPAPAPSKRPVAPPPARPAKERIPLTISIKKRAPENAPAPELQPEQEMNEPFTEEALVSAWLRFADSIHEETVLMQAMRSCRPRLKENYSFLVVLDNQGLVDKLNARAADLMYSLRQSLRNTHIEMTVRESEKEERKLYSPSERYGQMVENNPELDLLRNSFGLELA